MNAKQQYQLSAADLEVVLALVRCGTLAGAGERLGMDASTVFRHLQRIERGLGQALFERSRQGYQALDLAWTLAAQAEQVETALEAARSSAQLQSDAITGCVRITTTDAILHGLVVPALKTLHKQHPRLTYDLHTSNELLSLTRRDADIAVRATKRPPQHVVGKRIGSIQLALYAAKKASIKQFDEAVLNQAPWIAPDEAMPEHPSVVWRKKHFPKVVPSYKVSSILSAMEFIALGLGVGLLPTFLAQSRADLRPLTEALDDCQTDLWLLTHPEARHLLRVKTVYGHLAESMQLPG
ncbi:MAG: LysR family transcriptional regulator [Burkholderiales bacterium]|nr:LysR family transcriptional regulator [Burkholderiales bacterium]